MAQLRTCLGHGDLTCSSVVWSYKGPETLRVGQCEHYHWSNWGCTHYSRNKELSPLPARNIRERPAAYSKVSLILYTTVKPVISGHSKNRQNKDLNDNGSLMKVESITECSPWSILQYFWPALSDNWSWKPIFGVFESGCFRQVLLSCIRLLHFLKYQALFPLKMKHILA